MLLTNAEIIVILVNASIFFFTSVINLKNIIDGSNY